MKRKLLHTLLALVCVLCCAFGWSAYSSAKTGLEYEKVGDGYHVAGYYYAGSVPITEREPLNLTIPSEYNGNPVTGIGKGVFDTHPELVKIELPDSVKVIEDNAFKECTGLSAANLGKGVTSIGYGAFFHCEKLSEITIPDGVTSISNYSFYGCVALTKVTVSDSVTGIGNCAFSGCAALTKIEISSNVVSIGEGAFTGCIRLESIVFDGTKEQWDAVTTGTDWIKGCTKLKNIFCTGGADGEEYFITVN